MRDLDSVVARLDRLERQNRRLKFTLVLAVLSVSVAALVGAARSNGRIIQASEFQVVDDRGNITVHITDGKVSLLNDREEELVGLHGIGHYGYLVAKNRSTDARGEFNPGQVKLWGFRRDALQVVDDQGGLIFSQP